MAVTVAPDHWLSGVRRCPSANCDARPGAEVSLLIIHNISLPPGQFGGGLVDDLFCNALDCSRHPDLADLAGVAVSAHLLIDRTGATTQYVPFNERAWHAGASSWRGRNGCNDFAIGIELEGTDELAYEPVQYDALISVTLGLFSRYPLLHPGSVVGHQEVAPDRKSDPGVAFDWTGYLSALNEGVRRGLGIADRY